MGSIEISTGAIVLANGATIITVIFSALKLSNQFGILTERVHNNNKRIGVNEKRIHDIEKAN